MARPKVRDAIKGAIERRPIGQLKPDPDNPRVHSAEQVEELAESIKAFGWTQPILVDPEDRIIAGHGRLEAARLLRLKDVPVIVEAGDWDEAKRAGYALADNRLAEKSSWDDQLLDLKLGELDDLGFDRRLAGFDPPAAEDEDEDESAAAVQKIHTGDVEDDFWISIRGPLKHQAVVLQRMKEAVAELPSVDVELGTIALEQ